MKPYLGQIETLGVPPSGDTKPDSIAAVGHTTFVEYANTSQSDGSSGSSQIVQYDQAGNVLSTYNVAGSVDGMKYNPINSLLYALQNQDGNSTLTLIDPKTGAQSSPIAYAQTSGSRGFDDIVFDGSQTFVSYTNPSNPSDAIISKLANGNSPFGPLNVSPVLREGATGYNTVTHQSGQVLPDSDPDSLKLTPNGDLLLSSGSDGAIIDVHNPGKANQAVSFTQITDIHGTPASGVDDVIKPSASSGTFTLIDTTNNTIQRFDASNLNQTFYYGSVSSLGGFGQINPSTGVFTLLVPASGAHGVSFQPSTEGGHYMYSDHGGTQPHSAPNRTPLMSSASAQLAATLLDAGMASVASPNTPINTPAEGTIVADHSGGGHGFKLHG